MQNPIHLARDARGKTALMNQSLESLLYFMSRQIKLTIISDQIII